MAQTPCCIQHVCLQPPGVHLGSEEVLAAGSSPAFALNAAPGAGGAAQAPPGQSKVGVHAGALCIYWVHCGEKEGNKRRVRFQLPPAVLTAAARGRGRPCGVGGCAVGLGWTSGHRWTHANPEHRGTPTYTHINPRTPCHAPPPHVPGDGGTPRGRGPSVAGWGGGRPRPWVPTMHVVVKGELLPGADGAGGEEGDAGQAFVQVLNEDVVDLQVGVALRGWGGVRWSPLPLKLG